MTGHRRSWQYTSPVRVVFGPGAIEELPQVAPGHSLLVVTTTGARRRGTLDRIRGLLSDRLLTIYDEVSPEPQLSAVEEGASQLRKKGYDGVVALGGGSVIDTAKTLSYLLNAEPQAVRQHLERAAPLPAAAPLPVVAVPTTAGTGAEVTPFATIWDFGQGKKYSLAAPALYPQVALLDPELTLSAPRDLTLSTGLDALCQGLESLWSRSANPVAKSFGLRSVPLALQTLPRLVDDLDNLELRTQMMEASLLAGLAIASTKTTLAHSISYPLTLRFAVPHGLACAFTIAQVTRFNAEGDDGRLSAIAQALGFTSAEQLAEELERLLLRTGAHRWLLNLLPSKGELLAIAPQALTPGRADNNPRSATVPEIAAILAAAWERALEGGERRPPEP